MKRISEVRKQLDAAIEVFKFKPHFSFIIIVSGVITALMEGIGIGFIVPIIEIVQSQSNPTQEAEGVMLLFIKLYEIIGIPFSLATIVVGVSIVISIRWVMTFFTRWFREILRVEYIRHLQKQSFQRSLDARIEYFDKKGSDDILNTIVTQAEYAGRVITYIIRFIELAFLVLMYVTIAFIFSPTLTTLSIILLGGFSFMFRNIIEPGYGLGDKVAEANERIQEYAQAGIQGIRDVKIFGLKQEMTENFGFAIDQYRTASIRLRRNEQAIQSFYNLLTALSVFLLIFLAVEVTNLKISTLGVFLFAMFRLSPNASSLNTTYYQIENNLPHLIRTQQFTSDLENNLEPSQHDNKVPDSINKIVFEDVSFSYESECILENVNMEFNKKEFVGIAGSSGGGKSTIVSMIARFYEPDEGKIRANGVPIDEVPLDRWRQKVSFVRQRPYIFNDTLRFNLTIGNRSVSDRELQRAIHMARVDEFLQNLPNGLDTVLGDDAVKLSGGQRQRVAIARALIKDSDILILDEATSDLDTNLERDVQTAIGNMDRDYILIVIAHRLSTIKNADEIYTIADGKISETGTHAQLLDQEGIYSKLYNIQQK